MIQYEGVQAIDPARTGNGRYHGLVLANGGFLDQAAGVDVAENA